MRIAVQCERIVPDMSAGIEHFIIGLLAALVSVSEDEHEFHVAVARGMYERWREVLPDTPHVELHEVTATASLAHAMEWLWRVEAIERFRNWLRHKRGVRAALRSVRKRVEGRALSSFQPDVVYYPFHLADVTASPAVVTAHDLRELQPESYDALGAEIVTRNLRRAQAIVSSWRHPFSQVKDFGGSIAEKSFLIPFPLLNQPDAGNGRAQARDLGSDRPDGQDEVPLILYASTTAPHKNHVRLVQALAKVLEQENVRLVCTGAKIASGYAAARRAAAQLGISDRVEFTGFISTEELRDYYRRASVIAVPSLWEAASGAVYEGFAYHKPVTCANVPPIRSQVEFCGGRARFFDPLDPDDIAQGILEVLRDPEPYVEGSRQAAEFLRRLTWERTARDYLNVFEWVSSGCPPGSRPVMSVDRDPATSRTSRGEQVPEVSPAVE